jgi:nicotinic acid mononucleotide adenylyltransferase/nicotinamide mononucleotide (NMN) deamidase PncC
MNYDNVIRQLCQEIAKANPRIYLCASGTGGRIQQYLQEIPGAGSYLMGASFPYATDQMDDFLGFKPEKYCSSTTAMQIALESYYRAFDPNDTRPAIGFGLSGVVAATREHKGGNRIICAAVTEIGCHVYKLDLPMRVGLEARLLDNHVADLFGIYCLHSALGLVPSFELLTEIMKTPIWGYEHSLFSDEVARDLVLKLPYWDANNKRGTLEDAKWHTLLYPGAFNPPHYGHHKLAREAQSNQSNVYEHNNDPLFMISVDNPHKPWLSVTDILKRAKMLKGSYRVFTVGEPLFTDKVNNWPATRLIIGTDTLDRLLDPKWGPTTEEVITTFRNKLVQFYVANRTVDGELLTLEQLKNKWSLNQYNCNTLFLQLHTVCDISSTELRNKPT